MDIENLSYDYIKRFFDMYFDEGDLNDYYFCKECRTMQEMESLEHNQIQTTEDIKFLNSIIFIERDYICNNEFCEKDILFNKAQCNEKNLEDLSDNEIINIMNKYISEHEYLEWVYCKLCKIIRIQNLNDAEIIIKDGIKYLSGCCDICYIIYPECCIDYYKLPLGETKNDICIDCYNETTEIYLKPAKEIK
jgi:hypothetical protein